MPKFPPLTYHSQTDFLDISFHFKHHNLDFLTFRRKNLNHYQTIVTYNASKMYIITIYKELYDAAIVGFDVTHCQSTVIAAQRAMDMTKESNIGEAGKFIWEINALECDSGMNTRFYYKNRYDAQF